MEEPEKAFIFASIDLYKENKQREEAKFKKMRRH